MIKNVFTNRLAVSIILTLALIFAVALASSSQAPQGKTCKGTTVKGNPCASVIIKKSGYCAAHDPGAIHCAAKKTNGEPCKMIVKEEGSFCRFHNKPTARN